VDRAVVVGNCQAGALEMMLSTNDEFTKRFELVSFPAVHEIPDAMVPELHRAVADAAVVIPQRVQEDYRGGIGLGTEMLATIAGSATVVRWPSVYWAGYFPDLFYLRDAEGQPVIDGPFDYHDRTILEAYASGLDVSSTCRLLEDPERPSDAQAWAADATTELDIRGQDCEVKVTSFIASRFRDELLFFTMNHPANHLLGFMAQQITDLIGIPGTVDYGRIPDEILGPTFYPLHANHVRALELGFDAGLGAGTQFKIRGVTYEPSEAVRVFFDYYAEHSELVEINVKSRVA
jgi:Polysaccharide biosynthesis enzyme WcbI